MAPRRVWRRRAGAGRGEGGKGRGAMQAELGFEEPCERKWLPNANAPRCTSGQERRGEAGEVSRWR